ncbi:hypothetical protein ACFFSY_00595 [Paenibacillus aurantiacus]|uniref:Lipoprotein n=1 Tax=Paenibacillus aurantiacus TaxID=1936118 RepID=A0ABV5KJK2_9BACL
MGRSSNKAVLLVVLMVSLLGLTGCGLSKDARAVKKIEDTLQAKYGEAFVVDGLGGGFGTADDSTLKATAYLKSAPNTRISAEITKDLKQVVDDYVNFKVAEAAKPPIEAMVKEIWPDAKITVSNDAGWNDENETDTSMSYEEFLKLHPENWQLVQVFLSAVSYVDEQGGMNQEAEIRKFRQLAERLKASKYLRSHVGFFYLSPDAYNRFEEAERSELSVLNFYHDEEEKDDKVNFVTGISFDLDENGAMSKDTEAFDKQFARWKDVRETN